MPHRSLTRHVRQAGTSAAIGAALLLYFGFTFHLVTPVTETLGTQSWWLFYHTLRIGGVFLGVVTTWLWTGHAPALLVDGVLSALIGAIFILTGIGMFLSDGDITQPFVNALCGMMFISAGLYNAKLYLQHGRLPTPAREGLDGNSNATPQARSPHMPANHADPNVLNSQHLSTSATEAEQKNQENVIHEEPSDGYLASFAKKTRGKIQG